MVTFFWFAVLVQATLRISFDDALNEDELLFVAHSIDRLLPAFPTVAPLTETLHALHRDMLRGADKLEEWLWDRCLVKSWRIEFMGEVIEHWHVALFKDVLFDTQELSAEHYELLSRFDWGKLAHFMASARLDRAFVEWLWRFKSFELITHRDLGILVLEGEWEGRTQALAQLTQDELALLNHVLQISEEEGHVHGLNVSPFLWSLLRHVDLLDHRASVSLLEAVMRQEISPSPKSLEAKCLGRLIRRVYRDDCFYYLPPQSPSLAWLIQLVGLLDLYQWHPFWAQLSRLADEQMLLDPAWPTIIENLEVEGRCLLKFEVLPSMLKRLAETEHRLLFDANSLMEETALALIGLCSPQLDFAPNSPSWSAAIKQHVTMTIIDTLRDSNDLAYLEKALYALSKLDDQPEIDYSLLLRLSDHGLLSMVPLGSLIGLDWSEIPFSSQLAAQIRRHLSNHLRLLGEWIYLLHEMPTEWQSGIIIPLFQQGAVKFPEFAQISVEWPPHTRSRALSLLLGHGLSHLLLDDASSDLLAWWAEQELEPFAWYLLPTLLAQNTHEINSERLLIAVQGHGDLEALLEKISNFPEAFGRVVLRLLKVSDQRMIDELWPHLSRERLGREEAEEVDQFVETRLTAMLASLQAVDLAGMAPWIRANCPPCWTRRLVSRLLATGFYQSSGSAPLPNDGKSLRFLLRHGLSHLMLQPDWFSRWLEWVSTIDEADYCEARRVWDDLASVIEENIDEIPILNLVLAIKSHGSLRLLLLDLQITHGPLVTILVDYALTHKDSEFAKQLLSSVESFFLSPTEALALGTLTLSLQ